MRIELLDASGVVVAVADYIEPGRADAVVPHYPGAVSWRAVDPVVIAAEETARAEAERLQTALLRGIASVLHNHENRVRVLEKLAGMPNRDPITLDQFKAALRAILGI